MYPRPLTGFGAITSGGIVVVPPAPSGDFEFGATQAELTALGGNLAADVEPDGSASITLIADDAVYQYNQVQSGLTIPLSAGNKYIAGTTSDWVAMEVEFELPALDSPSTSDGLQLVFNLAGTVGGGVSLFASGVNTGGFYTLISPETVATTVPTATGGTVRIGIDVNPVGAAANMTINGTATAPIPIAAGLDMVPFIGIIESSLSVGTDAGKKVYGRLIQDSADFTETHTAGAVALADALTVKV